jgi:ribosome maturation factor RimP
MKPEKIVRLAKFAKSAGIDIDIEVVQSKHPVTGPVIEANDATITVETRGAGEPSYIPVTRVRWIGLALA